MGDRPVSHRLPTRAGPVQVDDSGGTGPAVLLLAAAAHSRRDWDAVRPRLAGRFRTIALDWPGHGDSPPPEQGWTVTASGFADIVEDVVDALGLDRLALMGNSVGGFAAARFALRHPQRTWGLVLVDAAGFVPLTPLARGFSGAMGRPRFLRTIYPWFAHRYMRADTAFAEQIERSAIATARTPGVTPVMSALWRSFVTPASDLRAAAAGIDVPTFVVWGRRDPVLPVRMGRWLAATVPGARLSVLDTGHAPFVTRPAQFLAEAEPFLIDAGR